MVIDILTVKNMFTSFYFETNNHIARPSLTVTGMPESSCIYYEIHCQRSATSNVTVTECFNRHL